MHQPELGKLVLHSGKMGEISVDCCDQFAISLLAKVNHISADLDSRLFIENLDIQNFLPCLALWNSFSTISPEDVQRIVAKMRPTTCRTDPSLALFIKEARMRP